METRYRLSEKAGQDIIACTLGVKSFNLCFKCGNSRVRHEWRGKQAGCRRKGVACTFAVVGVDGETR